MNITSAIRNVSIDPAIRCARWVIRIIHVIDP